MPPLKTKPSKGDLFPSFRTVGIAHSNIFMMAIIFLGLVKLEPCYAQENSNKTDVEAIKGDKLHNRTIPSNVTSPPSNVKIHTGFKCYHCTSNERIKNIIPYDPNCGRHDPNTTIQCSSMGCLIEHKGFNIYEKGCYAKVPDFPPDRFEKCFKKYTNTTLVFGKCNAGKVDLLTGINLQFCPFMDAPENRENNMYKRSKKEANIHVEFCHCKGDLCNSIKDLPLVSNAPGQTSRTNKIHLFFRKALNFVKSVDFWN